MYTETYRHMPHIQVSTALSVIDVERYQSVEMSKPLGLQRSLKCSLKDVVSKAET